MPDLQDNVQPIVMNDNNPESYSAYTSAKGVIDMYALNVEPTNRKF